MKSWRYEMVMATLRSIYGVKTPTHLNDLVVFARRLKITATYAMEGNKNWMLPFSSRLVVVDFI